MGTEGLQTLALRRFFLEGRGARVEIIGAGFALAWQGMEMPGRLF